jgi:soluble lytic murein transglycosylase-like protein
MEPFCMRAIAAAVTLIALTGPASSLDPLNNGERDQGGYRAPVTGGAAPAIARSNKVQDRITHNTAMIFAFAPQAIAPGAVTRGGHGWDDAMDAHIARHAAANGVPIELARRVVKRESGGNPRAVSKGNYGLMQIRLGTAQAMGYRGNAQGLLDADTNMTYAMKYLAGAYRAANGNHDRAVGLYARGYYYEAKRAGFSAYDPPKATGIGALIPTAAAQ